MYESFILSKKISSYHNLKIVISNKNFGNISFQHPKITEQQTQKNRKRFFSSIGISAEKLINVSLCHGNKIFWAKNKDRGKGALSKSSVISFYDGLACDQKDIFLMITVADCFPVFFFDPKKDCIGILHAGWRGILNNISQEMVKLFQKRKGSNPKNIIAFIGPGLQDCHFEVKEDVFKPFYNYFGKQVAYKKDRKFWIDIPQAIKTQLLKSGLVKSNIEISPLCTFCEKKLFSSFRRDKDQYIAQGAIFGKLV